MPVPYTFANQTGNIALSQLDANFANVKAAADTAGTVTSSAQPAITSVGQLTSLTVSGNIRSLLDGVYAPAYYYPNGVSILASVATNSYGNSNVAAYLATYDGALTALTGNVTTVGSVNAVNGVFSGGITAAGNIQGGNIVTNGVINASRTISGGNLVANGSITGQTLDIISGGITAAGNIAGGNITTSGNVVASGRLQAPAVLSTGTIQGADLYSTGPLRGANLVISGNGTVSGNLVVSTAVTLPGSINISTTPNAAIDTTIAYKIPVTINGSVYYIALTSSV